MLVALSGSFQTTPSFYLDPKTGVTYNVAIQAPQYKLDSLAALESLPVTGRGHGAGSPATIRRCSPALPAARLRCWAIWPPSRPARKWAP